MRQTFVRRCKNCRHDLALAELADEITRIVKTPTSAKPISITPRRSDPRREAKTVLVALLFGIPSIHVIGHAALKALPTV